MTLLKHTEKWNDYIIFIFCIIKPMILHRPCHSSSVRQSKLGQNEKGHKFFIKRRNGNRQHWVICLCINEDTDYDWQFFNNQSDRRKKNSSKKQKSWTTTSWWTTWQNECWWKCLTRLQCTILYLGEGTREKINMDHHWAEETTVSLIIT